jgi:CheY-like chemotaxis protein
MSRPLTLAPYFHPTTVVLVDDNEAFMRSMTLEMPSSIALHGFTDPEDALAFLDEPIDLAPLVDRCFTLDRSHDTDAVIHLNLGLIEQEINYRQRFRRVSAVLVDYAMPSVDGLAFCERMTDPYARRAMLTGVADEKLAVEAFNAGLIHRFIPSTGPPRWKPWSPSSPSWSASTFTSTSPACARRWPSIRPVFWSTRAWRCGSAG